MKKIILIILLFFSTTVSALTTVSVLIPFTPGGPTDRLWRSLEDPLNKELASEGIVLVTEYAQGAGGLVAVNKLKSSNHTVLGFFSSSIAINSTLNVNSNYNSDDFIFVGYAGSNNMQIVSRFQNEEELINYCKSNVINYGSAGIGSSTHLLAAIFLENSKCKNTVHVPYRGIAMIIPDAVSGRVDFFVDYRQTTEYGVNLKTFPLSKDLKIWHVFVASKNSDAILIKKIQNALLKIKSDSILTRELESKIQVTDFQTNKKSVWFASEFEKYKSIVNSLKIN